MRLWRYLRDGKQSGQSSFGLGSILRPLYRRSRGTRRDEKRNGRMAKGEIPKGQSPCPEYTLSENDQRRLQRATKQPRDPATDCHGTVRKLRREVQRRWPHVHIEPRSVRTLRPV